MKRISEVLEILKQNNLNITDATLRNWCQKYDIGTKIGCMWYIEENIIPEITSGQIFLKKYRIK